MSSQSKSINECYAKLAFAIIIQAIRDWRRLTAKAAKGELKLIEQRDLRELEVFLKSGWCDSLLVRANMTAAELWEHLSKEGRETKRIYSGRRK